MRGQGGIIKDQVLITCETILYRCCLDLVMYAETYEAMNNLIGRRREHIWNSPSYAIPAESE
jgi:hypothetical protein